MYNHAPINIRLAMFNMQIDCKGIYHILETIDGVTGDVMPGGVHMQHGNFHCFFASGEQAHHGWGPCF